MQSGYQRRDSKTDADAALSTMLFKRRLSKPNGSALFTYRFSEEEFARSQTLLRVHGKRLINDRVGCAALVLFLSEWFRRERDGGAWDWLRPLGAADLEYTQNRPAHRNRELSYLELQRAIIDGLVWWGRPPADSQHTKKYLWTIVREAGFPLASTQEQTGFRRWLERAIAQMFEGKTADEAVFDTSGAIGSEDLRDVLRETATELCQALFDLKRKVSTAGETAMRDPILYLNETCPGWLEGLPLDTGAESVRSLIESVIETKDAGEHALSAIRTLRFKSGKWEAFISFKLSGPLSSQHQDILKETLDGAVRGKVYLKANSSASLSRPIALLEKVTSDDGVAWASRSLSKRGEFRLSLDEPASLVVQVGERTPAILQPHGAEAQIDPVLAFAPTVRDDGQGQPESFELLASASVRWSGPQLFLLVDAAVTGQLRFDSATTSLEEISFEGDRRLFRFSGRLNLEQDGTSTTWQTGCENSESKSLGCFGVFVPNLYPSAFRGMPTCFLLETGARLPQKLSDLHWRPYGARRWRPAVTAEIVGEGDLGLFEDQTLISKTRIRCLPSQIAIEFSGPKDARRLKLAAPKVVACRASGRSGALKSVGADEHWEFNLSGLLPGALISVELEWTIGKIRFGVRDQGSAQCMLNRDGDVLPRRQQIGVNTLSKINCWTRGNSKLLLEARSKGLRFDCVREVSGETPLAVFGEEVRSLFSLFEGRDTVVRAEWLGDSEWSAEIRRFETDIGDIDVDLSINHIRTALLAKEIEAIVAIPLLEPERTEIIQIDDIVSSVSFRRFLTDTVGQGPWILSGRQFAGGRADARLLETDFVFETEAPLQSALLIAGANDRLAALKSLCATSVGRKQFSEYTKSIIRCTRKHQIHPASFDVLRAIASNPDIGVEVLAQLREPEDIAGLLELELDLPFVWVLTSPHAWADTFVRQSEAEGLKYKQNGIDDETIAPKRAFRILEEVASQSPELSTHASFAALGVFKKCSFEMQTLLHSEKEYFRERVAAIKECNPYECASNMVRRRIEGTPPPSFQHGFEMVEDRSLRERFDPKFGDLISVPFLVAEQCVSSDPISPDVARMCHRSKLFDFDYFVEMTPHAVLQQLQKSESKSA